MFLVPLNKLLVYNKHCELFYKANPGRQISRFEFCGIFSNAYNEEMNMVNIFRGFRTTDIYPFNPLAIPAQACRPSNTSVLAPVTSIASEGEIPSGDKMPVCNEQPTQVPQSSLPISEDNTD